MQTAREVQPAPPAQRRSRLKRLIPTALMLIAAGAVAVIYWLPADAPQTPPVEADPVNVTVSRVRAIPTFPDTFDLTAIIEPNRVVHVAAEVAGRLEGFGQRPRDVTWRGRHFPAGATVEEGEPIAQGDPLVYLNQDLLQARYERAAAQFEYDRREYLRIVGLDERGASSPTELADARTRRDVSKAALAEATRALERTTIVAPTDGILNRLPMEIGEYASSGDTVAEIVDIHQVKVVVDLPERDVHYFQLGDQVEIIPYVADQAHRAGEITYISELADDSTRTTRVEITVDNPDSVLRSGQIARVRLTRRVLNNAIMIPLGAVIPLEHGRVVYIVRDGRAERRQVELGLLKGRRVQVLDGLQPNDLLIVAGHRFVGPGQSVTVIAEQ